MEDDLVRIHDASVQVLEETGMVFQSQRALDLLKHHGARVTGKTAYISRDMISDALYNCPQKIKWQARNDKNSIELGKSIHAQAGGGSVFIQDIDHGRRTSTLADFINIQKLYQGSDVIDIVGFTPVDAGDLEAETKHLYMQYETIKNSDKPIHGNVCGGRNASQMLDMAEITFGKKLLMLDSPVMGLSINTISPLVFGEDQLDTLFEYVKRNQIIIACPMAIGGISAPLSHVGMTVQVNAEILAMIVLVQLINPGNPLIIGPSSSFAYLKTGAYSAGLPDGMLHIITQIQLSRDFYKLPTRVLSGACDSKMVDAQAGYETMQNLMLSILAGADLVAHAVGVLDGIMTISYEKIIIDEELMRRAMYMATKPIDLSDEALSLDVINEIGPGGSYLLHQSVFNKCRDLFQPTVSDRLNYAEWNRTGSKDVVVRANTIFKERLAAAPDTFLDPDLDRELKSYMKKAMKHQ